MPSRSVMSDSLRTLKHGPPGSSVRVIFQARILEWAAISFSRGSSRPRDQTLIFCIGRVLYHQGSLMKQRVSGMKHYPALKTTPKASKQSKLTCFSRIFQIQLLFPLYHHNIHYRRKGHALNPTSAFTLSCYPKVAHLL